MIATAAPLTVDPLFLRHDLLIERGRLEMTIEDLRSGGLKEQALVEPLKARLAYLNDTLKSLAE